MPLKKLAAFLGVGLLAGFEREWSRKDLGVRTFALTALLGTLSAMISGTFALAALAAVGVVILLVNIRTLRLQRTLEITTSVSLQSGLSSFAGALRPGEIRSAILLGLIVCDLSADA